MTAIARALKNVNLFVALASVIVVQHSSIAAETSSQKSTTIEAGSQAHDAAIPLDTRTKYRENALRRLDFRVVGSSCPVCLHKLQTRIKDETGAVKAAVQLKSPYGAVIIYDSGKLSKEKILAAANEGEPQITFADIKDVPVKKVPLILVPDVP